MARNKVIIEFDKQDDFDDIMLVMQLGEVKDVIKNIEKYRQTLRKGEQRNEIPKQEVVDKLNRILYPIIDLL